MKTGKIAHIIVAGFMVVGLAGPVLAEKSGSGGPDGSCGTSGGRQEKRGPRMEKLDRREARMEEMMKEIGVTDRQEKKLKEARDKQMEERKAIREKMREKHAQIREELDKEKTDTKKIDALIEELGELDKEKNHQRVSGVLNMKNILTPEQFKKLNEKAKGFMEKRKDSKRKHIHQD